MAAAGSSDFQIERQDNKVFVKPMKSGAVHGSSSSGRPRAASPTNSKPRRGGKGHELCHR